MLTYIPIHKTAMKNIVDRAHKLGNLNGSITKGKGNITGMAGEEIVKQFHEGWQLADTRDYDFVLPDGTTVDVKAKSTRTTPKPHFECSIATWNTRQKTDVYYFVRVKYDFKDKKRQWTPLGVYLLGWISKKEYFEKATLVHKGDRDPSNGWVCSHDCYNLPISQLHSPMEEVKI